MEGIAVDHIYWGMMTKHESCGLSVKLESLL